MLRCVKYCHALNHPRSRRPRVFRGIRGQHVSPFVIKAAKVFHFFTASSLFSYLSSFPSPPRGSAYRWANVGSRVTFCARPVITRFSHATMLCSNVRDVHALRASCGNLFMRIHTDPRDGREGLNEPLITGVSIFFQCQCTNYDLS